MKTNIIRLRQITHFHITFIQTPQFFYSCLNFSETKNCQSFHYLDMTEKWKSIEVIDEDNNTIARYDLINGKLPSNTFAKNKVRNLQVDLVKLYRKQFEYTYYDKIRMMLSKGPCSRKNIQELDSPSPTFNEPSIPSSLNPTCLEFQESSINDYQNDNDEKNPYENQYYFQVGNTEISPFEFQNKERYINSICTQNWLFDDHFLDDDNYYNPYFD